MKYTNILNSSYYMYPVVLVSWTYYFQFQEMNKKYYVFI